MVTPKNYDREATGSKDDDTALAMKNVVVAPHAYEWEGESSRTIIYDLHGSGLHRPETTAKAPWRRWIETPGLAARHREMVGTVLSCRPRSVVVLFERSNLNKHL